MAQGSLKVAGPFRGAAFVESVQTPQHDELSVNVQYAYGRKQPRDGFPYVVSNFGALNARLGLYDHGPGIPQYILYVGPKTNTFEIIVKVLDGSGVPVAVGGNPPGYEFNLTTLYGEPVAPSGRFHVTFVQTMLSSITATTRFVLLIVTEHTTYVFDPTAGTTIAPMSTAQVSAGGDAIRAYDGSMAYLDTAPYGRTACKWNNSVVYAGFDIGDTVTLTQPNPLAGTSTTLTDVVQDSTRQIQSLAPYLNDRPKQ